MFPKEESKNSENLSANSFSHLPKQATAQGLTYVIGAFGFVAALAWNEAIKSLLDRFFKSDNNVVSLFVYASVVTIIAIIATARLAKINQRFSSVQEKK